MRLPRPAVYPLSIRHKPSAGYNPAVMTDWSRIVFVLYCTTAGLLLLYAPWSPAWDTMLAALPGGLRLLDQPWLRGALSGFGLVHLVWVLHEIEPLLSPPADQPGDRDPRSASKMHADD